MLKPNVEPLLKCKTALYESEQSEMHGKLLEAIEYAKTARLLLDAWLLSLCEAQEDQADIQAANNHSENMAWCKDANP